MGMRERVAELEKRRAEAKEMGGPARVEKQHARGKLDVRQRIEKLFDPGTFTELGLLANNSGALPEELEGKSAPADGVITGFGEIDGRMACCAAYDFTVMGGSLGAVGERKVARIRELALKQRVPIVWLVDSGGARISDVGGFAGKDLSTFADTGYLFREQVTMSGVVPQVAAMVGPGAAGTAYIPGLADFVPMVKGTSSIAIGGPYLVKSTVGEDITEEALGGSRVHNDISGVADQEYADDTTCLAAIREYLGFFPSSCDGRPPRKLTGDPADRREDALLDLIPDESRKAYDVRKVIALLVDGGRMFEMKPRWAKNICTTLARIDGWPVGIVANNPQYFGGILDVNAADKAARFINLCDAFNIPLVFLQDVPGFMVGSKVEQQGIIRHGAKMLYATSTATVPKLTVILRKGYGAGYYVMNGRAYEPDLFVAWPGAEVSVMGAEGLVSIAAAKVLAAAENPAETKKALADMIRPHINIYRVAALGMIDDVIDPRDTRPLLARALKLTANKTVERPHRKREIAPV